MIKRKVRTNNAISIGWHKLSLLASILENIGSYVLVGMVLLTSTDIFMRRFFNSPFPFTFELTEYMLVVVAWCYIAFTTAKGRHVSVDTLTSHFPARVRSALVLIGDFITIILFGLIAWQNVLQGMNVYSVGTTSGILDVPKWPFQFWVAFGSALACIIFLFKVLDSLVEVTGK